MNVLLAGVVDLAPRALRQFPAAACDDDHGALGRGVRSHHYRRGTRVELFVLLCNEFSFFTSKWPTKLLIFWFRVVTGLLRRRWVGPSPELISSAHYHNSRAIVFEVTKDINSHQIRL